MCSLSLEEVKKDQAARQMMKKLATTPIKWHDLASDAWFFSTPWDVLEAELEINNRLNEQARVLLDEWAGILGANVPHGSNYFSGWDQNCLLEAGEFYLSFHHAIEEDKEHGIYFTVCPDRMPCDGFMDCFG